MPEYRRAWVPGGSFFFTLVTEQRAPFLCTPHARSFLRMAIQKTQQRWPFTIEATVLLPDHLHAIRALPDGDSNFSRRWAFLKKEFTQAWLSTGAQENSIGASRVRNRRRGVWQRRFWEHAIRDDRDFANHCDYIHFNPVKHGVVRCPHDWPNSSFHKFVRRNIYATDWRCSCHGKSFEPPDDLSATAME